MTSEVNGNLQATFAERLRATMHERRMSVGRLAETTGISERLIRKYRAGDVEPRDSFGDPTENGRAIARSLRVPLRDLLPSRERAAA